MFKGWYFVGPHNLVTVAGRHIPIKCMNDNCTAMSQNVQEIYFQNGTFNIWSSFLTKVFKNSIRITAKDNKPFYLTVGDHLWFIYFHTAFE